MDTNEIIKTLEENGGKLWEKESMRRVYFNAETALNMEISRYKTGNINHASINGESISNSEAYRALNCKFWFDLTDGKFHDKGLDSVHNQARAAAAEFIAGLTTKIS